MFSLTIVFGPGPTAWQLLFKTQEMARAATKLIYEKTTDAVEDDFGHTCIVSGEIHGLVLEDLEVSKMGHIELALHQARTQAKAHMMGNADPALKAAGLMNPSQGGPAMLSPMYNGRG